MTRYLSNLGQLFSLITIVVASIGLIQVFIDGHFGENQTYNTFASMMLLSIFLGIITYGFITMYTYEGE